MIKYSNGLDFFTIAINRVSLVTKREITTGLKLLTVMFKHHYNLIESNRVLIVL